MKLILYLGLFFVSIELVFSQHELLPSVKNVRDIPNTDEINIYYDLEGKLGQEYKVTLFLRILKSEPVEIELKNVSGDIGIGRFTGKNRRIIWKGDQIEGIDDSTDVRYHVKVDVFTRSISNANPVYDTLKNEYYIYYDLEGKPEDEFNVSVFLNIYKDSIVCKKLNFVKGDVGLCRCAGRNRKIIWEALKDTSILRELSDNMFEFNIISFTPEKFIIQAEPVVPKTVIEESSNLKYWIGGAILVGVGITVAIIVNPPPDEPIPELPDLPGIKLPLK